MDSKTELLVFNKKEIIVIVVLLGLVALFSFTLGLRLGKTLGVTKASVPIEHSPLSTGEPASERLEVSEHPPHVDHAEPGISSEHTEHAPATGRHDAISQNEKAAEEPNHAAEDRADTELANEINKEKIHIAKPVHLSLPTEKKTKGKGEVNYTLQVGSHRTIAEATEQVTTLKRLELDAFYLEAKLPGKGTWYRVGVGVFPSKEVAEKTAAKWKVSKALPNFIVQKIVE